MANKEAVVAELTEQFGSASAVLLTEYRGLTVAQLKELRNNIRDDASYAVVKNTLARIAAKQANVEIADDSFSGPTAVAFVHGDIVNVAKAVRDFAKSNELLVVKGGVVDGAELTAEDVNKLADLDSREVTLAKLAGAFKAPMFKAAALFNAPASKAARAINALREKQEAAN